MTLPDTCPKCLYPQDPTYDHDSCPRCGIVYAKFTPTRNADLFRVTVLNPAIAPTQPSTTESGGNLIAPVIPAASELTRPFHVTVVSIVLLFGSVAGIFFLSTPAGLEFIRHTSRLPVYVDAIVTYAFCAVYAISGLFLLAGTSWARRFTLVAVPIGFLLDLVTQKLTPTSFFLSALFLLFVLASLLQASTRTYFQTPPELRVPAGAPSLPSFISRFTGQTLDGFAAAIIALGGALALRLLPVAEEVPGYVALGLFPAYLLLSDGLPGGSFGKRFLGLRVVVRSTGLECSYWRSLLRNLTQVLGPLDWFWALHSSGLRLGDLLAGTQVRRTPGA